MTTKEPLLTDTVVVRGGDITEKITSDLIPPGEFRQRWFPGDALFTGVAVRIPRAVGTGRTLELETDRRRKVASWPLDYLALYQNEEIVSEERETIAELAKRMGQLEAAAFVKFIEEVSRRGRELFHKVHPALPVDCSEVLRLTHDSPDEVTVYMRFLVKQPVR
jgi:hypothetical protein